MKYKKFFVQVDMPGMISQSFSSRNAAIRCYNHMLKLHDGYSVLTNAKSMKEPVFPDYGMDGNSFYHI